MHTLSKRVSNVGVIYISYEILNSIPLENTVFLLNGFSYLLTFLWAKRNYFSLQVHVTVVYYYNTYCKKLFTCSVINGWDGHALQCKSTVISLPQQQLLNSPTFVPQPWLVLCKTLLNPVFVVAFKHAVSARNNPHIQQNHCIIACYTKRAAAIFIIALV